MLGLKLTHIVEKGFLVICHSHLDEIHVTNIIKPGTHLAIEVGKQWPSFGRRHFQIHCLQ